MRPSRKSGRPKRREAGTPSVERRILDSACNLFYKEGLHAVGVDRVLAEAGAAKASLYTHYSSKADLVAAYLERRSDEWRARAEEAVAAGGSDGREGLRRLFGLVEEWVASPGFRGCPFQNAASELPDADHPARRAAARHREWLHALVRELVKAAGVDEIDPVSRAIVVLYDGAVASALLDDDPKAVAAARFAAERLLDHSGPPPPKR
jgi:AcrR family transcriptional regulator